MADPETLKEIASAYEILLTNSCTEFYPGRTSCDVMQPIEICCNVLENFLMKIFPAQRAQFIDRLVAKLLEIRGKS
jgi:hypothetical protein